MAKPQSRWLSPGTGLGIGLFFLLSLVLLGYTVFFALTLGILGGLSAAWSIAWWSHADNSPPKHTIGQRHPLERIEHTSRTPGIEEAQRLRRLREQRSPQGRLRLLNIGLLRRSQRRR